MYCQGCGKQLDDSTQFCNTCGRPVAHAAFTASPSVSQPIGPKVRVLGILWAVYGGFRLVIAVWTVVFGHIFLPMFATFIPHDAAPFPLIPFMRAILLWSAIYSAAAGLLGIWAAWGLVHKEPLGRILALVAAFMCLISIPVGTALGVYTLVVLLPESARDAYQRLCTTS
jgi:hypothetical protein